MPATSKLMVVLNVRFSAYPPPGSWKLCRHAKSDPSVADEDPELGAIADRLRDALPPNRDEAVWSIIRRTCVANTFCPLCKGGLADRTIHVGMWLGGKVVCDSCAAAKTPIMWGAMREALQLDEPTPLPPPAPEPTPPPPPADPIEEAIDRLVHGLDNRRVDPRLRNRMVREAFVDLISALPDAPKK